MKPQKKTAGTARHSPLITVVMITYNGVRYFDDAVRSMLEQTDRNFEVVIVNDASTDQTPLRIAEAKKEFEKAGIRCRTFVNERNRGTGYSWGRAVSLAETPWVLFLADDDLYMPERVERVKEFISAHGDAPWFYHDVVILKEATGERRVLELPPFNTGADSMRNFFGLALKNVFMVHNAVALRKDVYDASGGFRDLRGVEDFDFWMRLIEQGYLPLKMQGQPLMTYRSRGLDASRFPYQSYYGSFAQVMNDFLDRYKKRPDADASALALAREFRTGVYIAYIMRCVRRGNVVLALKAKVGMVQRDFSILQFLKMAAVKSSRIFRGEN